MVMSHNPYFSGKHLAIIKDKCLRYNNNSHNPYFSGKHLAIII